MEKILAKALVSARGQIAIPKEIKERMKVQEGDYIVFVEDGNNIIIKTGKLVVQ